jgi:hypothetical protein
MISPETGRAVLVTAMMVDISFVFPDYGEHIWSAYFTVLSLTGG